MQNLHSLEQKLKGNLNWHGARIKFLARFMAALIQTRTVNLAEIATVFAGRAQAISHEQRCRRFLKDFDLPLGEIARLIVKLLDAKSDWTLVLDRTNWQCRGSEINLLVLAMVVEGLSYPVLWFDLNKAGNSHTDERILLLELFLELFGKERIATLLGDREFVGKQWLQWLRGQELPFELRAKENFNVTWRGRRMKLRELFRHATTKHPVVLKHSCEMWGARYYFSGSRLPTGQYLIVVSSTFVPDALTRYAQRWKIETLFHALKSRGFNLEDTRVTAEDRLQKLFALVALTLCWCHRIGLWLHERKPLKVKKHGRLPKSLFRCGLDALRRLLTNPQASELFLWHHFIGFL
jgi:hypothetical protein